MNTDAAIIEDFVSALLALDRVKARKIFMDQTASHGAIPVMENMVSRALDNIGSAWEKGQLALSQIYMAGRICEDLSMTVVPDTSPSRRKDPGLALVVFEDQHLLGKRMVHAVLRNSGYAVADWGAMSLSALTAQLSRNPVDILMVSCLMLSSALRIALLREAIDSLKLPVKLVVGGAPFRFDKSLWREAGAHACGNTASDSLTIIHDIIEGNL
ncbi:MAG: cobalamin B12-binding domain-containing protein [Spirochaetes bacterium]|nr:cobalamin B12-binding domain-containing protein [Spirochaetota bacterium]